MRSASAASVPRCQVLGSRPPRQRWCLAGVVLAGLCSLASVAAGPAPGAPAAVTADAVAWPPALPGAGAPGAEMSPPAWLRRVQQAARSHSYEGTVVFAAGSVVASSRVGHYRHGGESFEKIEALDGRQQRRYRHDDKVLTLWPDERVATMAQRDLAAQPGLLPALEPRLHQHYEVRLLGPDRVAGRRAEVVLLRPRDAWRHAQRLWVDRLTGLPLRTDVLSPDGAVLESCAFTELRAGVVGGHDAVLASMREVPGWRRVHLSSKETRLEQEGWAVGALPPGFVLVGAVRKALAFTADPAVRPAAASTVQVVLSDGLARVSVFIEPLQGPPRPAFMTRLGATHTLAQPGGDDHWLTLMGDVPLPTLQAIAGVLQRRP